MVMQVDVPAGRSKRPSKAPARFLDSNEFWNPKQKQLGNGGQRQVYRLLRRKDITRDLKEQCVYVKWPDDGSWWSAEVHQIHRKNDSMLVVYFDSEEEEVLKISEVLANKEIAVLEFRNPDAKLRKNEIPVSHDGTEVWCSPESDDDDDDDDIVDAGAIDDSDDDASVMSDAQPGDHQISITAADRQEMSVSGLGDKRKLSIDGAKTSPTNLQGRAFYGAAARAGGKVGPPSKMQKTGPAPVQRMTKQTSMPQSSKPSIPVAEIRKNAWTKFKECLELAVTELKGKGAEVSELKDPEQTGKAIEAECAKKHAKSGISKEYKLKFRALFFNLNDAKNEELRQRVVLGELGPERLVSMSNDELASKEVSQWRQRIEEKNKKMVVLDSEAAAKFSTAANQSLRRQELELAKEQRAKEEARRAAAAQQAREQQQRSLDAITDVQQHHALSKVLSIDDDAAAGADAGEGAAEPEGDLIDFDAFVQQADTGYAGGGAEADGGSPAYDDGSDGDEYRPTALDDTYDAPTTAEVEDPYGTGMPRSPAKPAQAAGAASDSPVYAPSQPIRPDNDREATPPLGDEERAFLRSAASPAARPRRAVPPSPRDNSQSGALGPADDDLFAEVEDLAPVVLPVHSSFPLNGAPGVKVWSGWLAHTASGTWKMDLQSLQGAGDLRRMVREAGISIKGKLAADALFKFFSDLRLSRSRTVTVGVLRLNATSDNVQDYHEFVDEMRAEGKVAACSPGGFEGYIIPYGELTASLSASAYVAAPKAHRRSIKENVGEHDLMLAIVHAREPRDSRPAQELTARLRKDKKRAAKQARLSAKREAANPSSKRDEEKPEAKVDPVPDAGRPSPQAAPTPPPAAPADPRQRAAPTAATPAKADAAPAKLEPAAEEKPATCAGFDIAALAASVMANTTSQQSAAADAGKSASADPAASLGLDLGSSLTSLAAVLGIGGPSNAASTQPVPQPAPAPAPAAESRPAPTAVPAQPVPAPAEQPVLSQAPAMQTLPFGTAQSGYGGAASMAAPLSMPQHLPQPGGGPQAYPSAPIIIPHHMLSQQPGGAQVIPAHLLQHAAPQQQYAPHQPQYQPHAGAPQQYASHQQPYRAHPGVAAGGQPMQHHVPHSGAMQVPYSVHGHGQPGAPHAYTHSPHSTQHDHRGGPYYHQPQGQPSWRR